ncbi:MAG: hypothetical protein ACRC5M_07345 [Anaeroplasmataceae bacterium]
MRTIRTFPKEYIEKVFTRQMANEKILISITSTCETPLEDKYKNMFKDSISIVCDDLGFYVSHKHNTKEISDFNGMRNFSENDVETIDTFVKKYPKADIVVHCQAGVSRSGAVAVGITMMEDNFEEYRDVLLNNSISPNELILIEFIKKYNPIKTGGIANLQSVLDKKRNPDSNFCMKTFVYKTLDISDITKHKSSIERSFNDEIALEFEHLAYSTQYKIRDSNDYIVLGLHDGRVVVFYLNEFECDYDTLLFDESINYDKIVSIIESHNGDIWDLRTMLYDANENCF